MMMMMMTVIYYYCESRFCSRFTTFWFIFCYYV